MAVRSACCERGWLRSTSCIPSRCASMVRIASRNRCSSTRPSTGERPLRMLKVAISTSEGSPPARGLSRTADDGPGRSVHHSLDDLLQGLELARAPRCLLARVQHLRADLLELLAAQPCTDLRESLVLFLFHVVLDVLDEDRG